MKLKLFYGNINSLNALEEAVNNFMDNIYIEVIEKKVEMESGEYNQCMGRKILVSIWYNE